MDRGVPGRGHRRRADYPVDGALPKHQGGGEKKETHPAGVTRRQPGGFSLFILFL
jgi:hypothetical protein